MNFIDKLYLTVQSSEPNHSIAMTNDLNTNRLLLGRPDCWRTAYGSPFKKPKTLIIDERTLPASKSNRWEKNEKNKTIKKKIVQLKKMGFPVYVYKNSSFLEYDIYENSDDEDESFVELSAKEIIHEAVRELDISQQEVFFLDKKELDLLYENDDNWPKLIDQEQNEKKKCLELPRKFHKNIDISSVKEISISVSEKYEEQKALADLLPTFRNITRLELDSDSENIINKCNLPHLEELKFIPTSVENKIDRTSNLENILAHSKKLKFLSLENCYNFDGDINQHLDLFSLELLNVRNTNINNIVLSKILCNAQNLRELNISRCYFSASQPIEPLNLRKLSFLKIDPQKIDNTSLKNLLANSLKLKTLSFLPQIGFSNYSEQILDQINLSSVENLSFCSEAGDYPEGLWDFWDEETDTIDFDKLTPHPLSVISGIIKKIPNLKTLQFNCMGFNGKLDPDLDLNQLKNLKLERVQFDTNQLNNLLRSAKNLQVLRLIDCNFEEDPDLLNLLNFDQLKELDLSGSNISDELIHKIKRFAPQLIIKWISDDQKEDVLSKKIKSDRCFIDADTTFDPNKEFTVTQIFYSHPFSKISDPEIESYRLDVYDTLKVNPDICPINEAFELRKNKDPESNEEVYRSAEDTYLDFLNHWRPQNPICNYFYGKQSLVLDNEWKPLASLSANEDMMCYHVSDPNAQVELAYSKKDNLYYIRSLSNQEIAVDVDFILKVDKNTRHLFPLPLDIRQKINACSHFGNETLKLEEKEHTGVDYLYKLDKQALGACRHRAVVFMAWMKENYPQIPTRIVGNDSHMFVEIYYEDEWYPIDLGGYEAELKLEKPNEPDMILAKGDGKKQQLEFHRNKKGQIVCGRPKRHYFDTEEEMHHKSVDEYIDYLFAENPKKRLIHLKDSASVLGLSLRLEDYCKKNQKPYFYIHSAADLIYFKDILKPNAQNIGEMIHGSGGPLYEFLKANEHQSPVLIVNYDNFSASELVQFNALLDKNPKAENRALPKNTQIFGLINPNKVDAYEGADFYSRFGKRPSECPFYREDLSPPIKIAEAKESKESKGDAYLIPLFHGADWEGILLGRWEFHGKERRFVEGELIKAIKSQKTHIEFNNAPWEDKEFEHFIQHTLHHGVIKTRYKDYKLPQNIQWTQSNDYSWNELIQNVVVQPDAPGKISNDTYLLNPTSYNRFFSYYDHNKQESTIHLEPGLLEQYRGKTLKLYLTAPLSPDAWARFLSLSNKNDIKINLIAAKDVVLPSGLTHHDPLIGPVSEEKGSYSKKSINSISFDAKSEPSEGDFAVFTNDIDASLAQLESKTDCFIDLSEIDRSALIKNIIPQRNEQSDFNFIEQIGVVLQELNKNNTVVLTGTIKPELIDVLNELVLKRKQNPIKGQGRLIILSNSARLIPGINSFEHKISVEDKKNILEKKFKNTQVLNEHLYAAHSLTELQAMLTYNLVHPQQDVSLAWQGMKDHIKPQELKEEKSATFQEQRLNTVEAFLQNAPFVFLAGKTGVGKSTFVEGIWQEKHPACHFGDDAKTISDWALDPREGIKTLFIDEANISKEQWSKFEGIFCDPPGIVVGNSYLPLTKNHKIIFAGNPMSYGGERHLPSFFARHGNSIMFEPLPLAYIEEKILNPILSLLSNDDRFLRRTAQPILNIAQFLTDFSPDKVLISPRELGQIALSTLAYCKKNRMVDPALVAHHYAYNLGKTLIPEEGKKAFEQYKPAGTLPLAPLILPDFHLNASNAEACNAINDALKVREFRQSNPNIMAVLKHQGLGGVMLEGEPGIGKSELAKAILKAHGFVPESERIINPKAPVYYEITAGMSLDTKMDYLKRAFHEGAVVIMDEFNTASSMERLLNNLLMGKDADNKPAQKSGFMVIATQNPPTYAGRTRMSNALQRRFHSVTIPPYSKKEMRKILEGKTQLPLKIIKNMIRDYIDVQKTSSKYPYCFRDLLKKANQENKKIQNLVQEEKYEEISPQKRKAGMQPHAHHRSQKIRHDLQFFSTPVQKRLSNNVDEEEPIKRVSPSLPERV